MLKLLFGVRGLDQVTTDVEQALDLDALDQAPDGRRRWPVLQPGMRGRMQQETMVHQQA